MIRQSTLLFVLFMNCSVAIAGWHVEGSVGFVHNFSTELKIDALATDADYETRSFERPLYYSVRVGSATWDVELIHQKIYLKNPEGEVQAFSISHGYNLILLNYARRIDDFIIRVGAGAVLAHPEIRFRENFFEPGYNLTGPAFQASVQKKFPISERLFLSAEGKFTAARAHFTINEMKVSAPNIALHALFGFGLQL
ncbi:hypothetical protein L0222_04275 [bacterium]|nr:hypothetical protein [bacterium]MCI0602484.1 hypothetical protein [bacterium]